MSLDLWFIDSNGEEVFSENITHNLGRMAEAAGFYKYLWRASENGICFVSELEPHLRVGLVKLIMEPKKYRKFDSPNGWGTYDNFVPWLIKVVNACEEYPEMRVEVNV